MSGATNHVMCISIDIVVMLLVTTHVMCISIDSMKVFSWRCSLLRVGSVLIQVMVICMCDINPRSNILLRVFTADTQTPDNIIKDAIIFNHLWYFGLSTAPNTSRTLFNSFYYYSCNREIMFCYSRIMPIYMIPVLLVIF